MKTNFDNQKLKITYPCEWVIKIIGSDEKAMRDAVDCIVKDRSYVVLRSNTSRTGKYISLNIKLTILFAEEKQDFYEKLTAHREIKFVL
jgi:uncharacterized protein